MPDLRPRTVIVLVALVAWSGGAAAQLLPEDVLLVWNSACVESQLVRDAYVEARPGVYEFDYADAALVGHGCSLAEGFDPGDRTFQSGDFDYRQFSELAREPLAAWFAGEDCVGCDECAADCTERQTWITPAPGGQFSVVTGPKVIVTTLGLPARIAGQEQTNNVEAVAASFESELAGFLFDLRPDAPDAVDLDRGPLFNPYFQFPTAVTGSTRILPSSPEVSVLLPNASPPFTLRAVNLPPGASGVVAFFPTSRLDARAVPGVAGKLEATLALVQRSTNLGVLPCVVRNVIDEWSTFGLDFDGLTDDYDATALTLRTIAPPLRFSEGTLGSDRGSIDTIFDQSNEFVSAAEAFAETRSTFILLTFGVNHSNTGAGAPTGAESADTDDDPATASPASEYLRGYDNVHPAGYFNSYESWSGHSLIGGGTRGGQQQGAEWIALGGSFATLTVTEPLTLFVANANDIVTAMLRDGRTWGEGSAASLLAYSWQNTPIGDPLATIGAHNLDVNRDGRIDIEDAYAQVQSPAEQNCDGSLDQTDEDIVFEALREGELGDLFATPSARD